MIEFVDVVFDGPPGPEPGRFVEVENLAGQSVARGEWIDRGDGYWALRLALHAKPEDAPHYHVAGTTVGKDIDECAKCGRDIRDTLHSSAIMKMHDETMTKLREWVGR